MTLKKPLQLLFTVGLIFLFHGVLVAQGPGRDWQAERGKRQQALIDSMGLDSIQKVMYKSIEDQFMSQAATLREKYTGQRDKIMEERAKYAQQRDEQLQAILTPDQWTIYKRIMDREREARSNRFRSG